MKPTLDEMTALSSRSPEGILMRMRAMNSSYYSAAWRDAEGRAIAACVIVDGEGAAGLLLAAAQAIEDA